MPLVVTGTIGIDTVSGPTGHAENVLGGSCTYFSAAASFYTQVRMVAAAGDDLPDEHREMIAKFEGIDTTGLEIREGSRTFRWGGKYMENMDQRETLFTDLGVLEEAPPPVPESYADSKYVFLANNHPAVQLDLLSKFPNAALAVADTMDLWINTANDQLRALLKKVHGLALNHEEAEQLTGKRNAVAAARHILEMGPQFVVLKKGEHGCLLIHREGIGALPAYPSETVIDPTGAGDSFAGGMMGFIASESERDANINPTDFDVILRALGHGTVVASFNIESFSLGRMVELTRAQIAERFDEFTGMLRVHG